MFADKLKHVMKELGISQAQIAGMTGIGKSSISQYVSGSNVPTAERQKHIAVSLCLAEDYFDESHPVVKMARQNAGVIAEIRPKDVAKLMRMGPTTVQEGLKQGVFPWGYAIKTSDGKHKYRYFINAKRFAEIEGIDVPPDMVV